MSQGRGLRLGDILAVLDVLGSGRLCVCQCVGWVDSEDGLTHFLSGMKPCNNCGA